MSPDAASVTQNKIDIPSSCLICTAGVVACRSCHGSGLYRTHDGDEVPCPSCFTEGVVICSACRGTGFPLLIARQTSERLDSPVGQDRPEEERLPDRFAEQSFWVGHRFQWLMAAYIIAIALMVLVTTFL
ncbi:hypothetical protein [Variovorax paradoxus]|jgi:DnaJ-class molecular chaperone|uniref:hypothetical protein n=1 Tax=Variovorax paradoxus TaxID=34073 RepID=UPI00155E5231